MVAARRMYSIGHSSHDLERFIELLRGHGIELVADVRSQPASQYAPQFDRYSLANALQSCKIAYEFCGTSLGGRPREGRFYDAAGHVLYSRMAESAVFLEGLEHLSAAAARSRVATLCAEEDPTHCHRRLLVARALETRGVPTLHIRGDGKVESEREIQARAEPQPALFPEEGLEWRSTRSVIPRRLPKSSSGD